METKDEVESKIGELRDKLGEIWDEISGKVSEIWEAIKTAVSEKVEEVKKNVLDKIDEIKTEIGKKVDDFIQVGKDIINGIKDGVLAAVGGLISAAVQAVKDALQAAKDAIFAESPSRAFAEVGKSMITGMIMGIVNNAADAKKAIADVAESMVGAWDANLGFGGLPSPSLAQFAGDILPTAFNQPAPVAAGDSKVVHINGPVYIESVRDAESLFEQLLDLS